MIIGISGKAKSGKDTAADMLSYLYSNPDKSYKDYIENTEVFFEKNAYVVHFADALKEAARELCILDEDQTDTQAGKLTVIPWLGITVRELLQKLGTCIREGIDEDFWIKCLFARVDGFQDIIVADVRYPNELQAIKNQGGVVIRINREGAGAGDHHSETSLDDYDGFDLVIDNNGTYEELYNKLKVLIKHFHFG